MTFISTALRRWSRKAGSGGEPQDTRDCSWVVQDSSGTVLAVFVDRSVAEQYAGARQDRRIAPAPYVCDQITLRTVHTRWLEFDAQGVPRVDDRDSYAWCPELDSDDGEPPAADVEEFTYEGTRRVLCVGTDDRLIEARVLATRLAS